MKNRILLSIGIMFITVLVFGQNLPVGMHYQAIARDLDGSLISNQEMSIKVEVMTIDRDENLLFEEIHNLMSNQYGLINLTIGEGLDSFGDFEEIPWSEQNIWVRVSVKKEKESQYRIVSSNKLYSVPYAYYANEAGNIAEMSSDQRGGGGPSGGSVWSLKGNKNADTHNSPPVMGTTDDNPVVFITNGEERMVITEEGEVEMNGDINVGGSAVIETDLSVNESVELNTAGGSTTINGPTTIGGPDMNAATFTGPVTMEKTLEVDEATDLNSSLNVDGVTDLNNTLNVTGGSTTNLTGALNVDGATDLNSTMNVDGVTDLNNTLNVTGGSTTNLSGALNVDGATDLNNILNVDGITDLNNTLNVTGGNTTNLTGVLNVDGATDLNNTLNVDGVTDLNNTLNVTGGSTTNLSGTLNVDGATDLNNDLNVDGTASFNSKVTFDINVTGDQQNQSSYPLLIKGSKQGLAIEVNPAGPESQSHRGNNYISFYRDGQQKGRIESMGEADINPSNLCNLFVNMINTPPSALANLGVSYDPFSKGLPNDISSLLNFSTGGLPNFTQPLGLSSLFSPGNLPFLNGGSLPSLSVTGGSFSDLSFPSISFSPGSLPTLDVGSLPNISDFNLNTILNPGQLPGLSFNTISGLINFANPFTNGAINPFCGYITNFNGEDPSSPAHGIWLNIKNSLQNSNVYPAGPHFNEQIYSNFTQDVLIQGISTVKSVMTFAASVASILDPEDIFSNGVSLVVDITSLTVYGAYSQINLGVAYESGAGDYAEWLLRANPEEFITQGEIVGVIGGKVSKEFNHANQFMVVSTAPLLLGNMPENNAEQQNSEKIAFMGQVPVRVQGYVKIGDYILPSGNGDGLGIAVSPENMMARDYQRIVGIAWENGNSANFINLINTAVGLNHNDMSKEMEKVQYTLNHIQETLVKLDPSYEVHHYEVSKTSFDNTPVDYNVSSTHQNKRTAYFSGKEYSDKEAMLLGVKKALTEEAGIDVDAIPIMKYIFDNPDQASSIASSYGTILKDMMVVREELSPKAAN